MENGLQEERKSDKVSWSTKVIQTKQVVDNVDEIASTLRKPLFSSHLRPV